MSPARARAGLPADWPEAKLRQALPADLRANTRLVGWLAQAVHTTMHFDQASEEGWGQPRIAWDEPKARDLRAIATAVKRLEAALGRLHPSLIANATMHAGTHEEEFRRALSSLQDEAEYWLEHRGQRRPGTKPNERRRYLEDVVAQQLRKASIRLTKYRAGVLARTLIACYDAAGLHAPAPESLLPTLQRLVDGR